MLKNYFIFTFRSLVKNKIISLLKILGLTLGIAAALLIYFWVHYQLSFDKFHSNYNNIYRLVITKTGNDDTYYAESPEMLKDAVISNNPEINQATHLKFFPKVTVKLDDIVFKETGIAAVDTNFYKIFNFSGIDNISIKTLKEPYNILISEDIRFKYFNHQNPIGKTLLFDSIQVVITGVFQNIPINSHIQFDMLCSIDLLKKAGSVHPWGFYTYITVNDTYDKKELSEKISKTALEKVQLINRFQMNVDVQELSKIHFDNRFSSEIAVIGEKTKVNQFIIIGFIILIIVSINYIIFLIAEINQNTRDWLVRRTYGAMNSHFLLQNVINALIHIFISVILALILIEFFWSYYISLINKSLVLNYMTSSFYFGIAIVIVFTLIVVTCVSIYFIRGINPLKTKREKYSFFEKKYYLNSGLIIIQIGITICVFIALFSQVRQFRFMSKYDKGFNPTSIYIFSFNKSVAQQYDVLKQNLKRLPEIQLVSMSSCPLNQADKDYILWEGKTKDDNVFAEVIGVDYDFFSLIQSKIIDGRDFSETYPTDYLNAFILTENASKSFDLKDPIGKKIQISFKQGQVVGMVKDMYFKSLKYTCIPQLFFIQDDFKSQRLFSNGMVFVKYKKGSEQSVKNHIVKCYNQLNTLEPIDLNHFDELLDDQYGGEKQLIRLFTGLSMLALFISCIGLYAIVSYIVIQKTKEIGIKKALGAPPYHLLLHYSVLFFKWILFSSVISIPLGYFIMQKLKQNFAYSEPGSISIILFSILLVVFVSVIPVLIRTLKIIQQNPVESLRYE